MAAIRLVNKVGAGRSRTAEFRLSQGDNEIARVGVHAGASAEIPTSNLYTVQATTVMRDFTLTSNIVEFDEAATTLVAHVLNQDGYYDFQLSKKPGRQPSAIVCENTWRLPVQFKLSQPGSPVQVLTVVDEHNTISLSTAEQWQCYAIVNGITTATVTINSPSAVVTLTADTNDDGFILTGG
ncbi:MAG: hypothetical protein HOW73_17285 [Polyangiaceae bacterium]|nr:hypothetical protein [Polyangiaceae bacterium]